MLGVSEATIACPYCGEQISILVDLSVTEQEYTEDCQVCCRPIVMAVTVLTEDEVTVQAKREDD